MKTAPHALLAATTLVAMTCAVGAATCAPGNPEMAGHYILNGEMEVGSQLLLQPDGQFEFMLAYGAIDQYGKGCWSVDGQVLKLQLQGRPNVPRRHSPADRRFRGMFLVIEDDGRLAWPLEGFRGRFERQ